jgi:3-isopropylmalate/(R)-2-methylmalate dehydratase large subunit
MSQPRTLFDKIWQSHLVAQEEDGTCLIYIDRHLIHEITSAQAFGGLEETGRKVRRPDLTLAVPDHNVPTDPGRGMIVDDAEAQIQIDLLRKYATEAGIQFFDIDDIRQGIVHIIGPEQGFTLPGTTVVCGDSHTATHGAFGALAFGIGTSEVEHVLATQTLIQKPLKNMRIAVDGALTNGVTAKDMILAIIGAIGTAGGTGHVIEYTGQAVRDLSMESRMTVCNMSIEAGARAGMVAPDETTFEYLMGRPMSPKAGAWEQAVEYWKGLPSDEGAVYDKEVELNGGDIPPQVTWGTSPQEVLPVDGSIPKPDDAESDSQREAWTRMYEYMNVEPGQKLTDIKVDHVFIGSCTNGRIEDMRSAAAVAKGRQVAEGVRAMIVPGSGLVKEQAEQEGLDQIFVEAGFDWREPGCSMCLAMNADKVPYGERCASTSNRNFEGRQGRGAQTHLVSPGMAAAAAIAGHLADVREFQ